MSYHVFDTVRNCVVIEAFAASTAELHGSPSRLIAKMEPGDTLAQGIERYQTELAQRTALTNRAKLLGIQIANDYDLGSGTQSWYCNGTSLGRIDLTEGWELIGKAEPMNAVFLICNVITGEAIVQAPTPELIEREFYRHDTWTPKRGPEYVIAEFPESLGINIRTFKMFPKSMIYDGITLYARRKTGKIPA